MQSARYNGKPAWFVGNSNNGDYYDQETGEYLMSWDRHQGAFLIDSKIGTSVPPPSLIEKIKSKSSNKQAMAITNPLTLPGRYVAFVGDSFCGSMDQNRTKIYTIWRADILRGPPNDASYLSAVADHFHLNIAHYGFPGRSWWYSWYNFWRDWKDRLAEIDAVIFLHTESNRINNAWNQQLPHNPFFSENAGLLRSGTDEQKAYKAFITHVIDANFQSWAHRQYLKYLQEQLDGMKTLHFFSFNPVSEATASFLPGMVFTDPLYLISDSESDHATPLFRDGLIPDLRCNHLNAKNNRTLADLIIECLENYRPGRYQLPMHRFDVPYFQQKQTRFLQKNPWPKL